MPVPAPTAPPVISSDTELYTLFTEKEPFGGYAVFPNAEEVTAGTLNGSTAHRPFVRVTLNAAAAGALVNGKLPAGKTFPDGALILKETRNQSGTLLGYAVMYKNRFSPLAGEGWLWAELKPNGSPGYSVQNRGGGCVGCHSLERGRENDHVRTFERQR
jgi:hypothetical protein